LRHLAQRGGLEPTAAIGRLRREMGNPGLRWRLPKRRERRHVSSAKGRSAIPARAQTNPMDGDRVGCHGTNQLALIAEHGVRHQ